MTKIILWYAYTREGKLVKKGGEIKKHKNKYKLVHYGDAKFITVVSLNIGSGFLESL